MPERFAFPVNHKLWVLLQLRPSGYAPLEGAAVRIFGRLAPGATQDQAYAEVTVLTERTAKASPETHEHLRPRVLAYGGESPGDRGWLELSMKHLPILLVLIVACANVGTLVYARTATRDAEIATRYALGATRGRIITQLFIEALVLASVAAFVGLAVANRALKWGSANPLAIGVRMSGDPAALAARLRPTAASLDAGLRLESVRSLDELAWRVDMPQMVVAGAIVSAVGLGLFLSAAGIFSLMSVSVSLRTREIGLRSALGATSLRLLTGIFSRAAVLVGGGVVAGNLVLILLVILAEEIELADVANALMITSAIMLTAGLLACIEPARRALRINPTDALKEM
jgi:hypothetical protein